MYKNLKIGQKIGSGFFMVLALLTIVVSINYLALNKANGGISQYRALAQDTNLIGHIQTNILMVRMNVKNYLITKSNNDLQGYKKYIAKAGEYVETAKTQITHPKRLESLTNVEKKLKIYGDAFLNVVALNKEQEKQYKKLVMDGQEMQGAISLIMTSGHAYGSASPDASYYASDVQKKMLIGRLYVVKYLGSNQIKDFKRAIIYIQDKLTPVLGKLNKNLTDFELRNYFVKFQDAHIRYVRDLTKISEIVEKRNTIIKQTLNQIGNEFTDYIDTLKLSIMQEQETLGPKLKAETDNSIVMSLLFAIIATLIGAFAAFVLTKIVTKPLNRAVIMAHKLADGDLTVEIKPTNNDETGILLGAMQDTVKKLREMLSTISSASNELATASEELSVITEQTAQGIAQEEIESDLVATAINQMTSTVHDVADNAAHAADAADSANKTAISGSLVVKNTISAINELSANVNDSSTKLSHVENEVVNISNILDVIKGVAEQTNLLALNAAIEAARAGEQGRGFAVVADEVRALASRTQESTQEIEAIIKKLQDGTNSTVDVMNRGKKQAELCVTHAEEAHQALELITTSINSINDLNFQIAGASEEQTKVVESINNSVVNVKHIAEENATGASQNKDSSNEIAKSAERLKQLVTQFKL